MLRLLPPFRGSQENSLAFPGRVSFGTRFQLPADRRGLARSDLLRRAGETFSGPCGGFPDRVGNRGNEARSSLSGSLGITRVAYQLLGGYGHSFAIRSIRQAG